VDPRAGQDLLVPNVASHSADSACPVTNGSRWCCWDGSIVFGPHMYPRANADCNAEAQPLWGDNYMHCAWRTANPAVRGSHRQKSIAIKRRAHGRQAFHAGRGDQDGDLAWQETVFSHLLGRDSRRHEARLEDKLVVQAHFRVCNTGYARRVGRLLVLLTDLKNTWFAYDATVKESAGRSYPAPLRSPPRPSGGQGALCPAPTGQR